MFFLNENSFANIVRSTTFDDRFACEKSRGSWRDFGNSCADKCAYKFDKYAVCAYAITYGCDCGKNRCLHEDKCIPVSEYKKIDDEKILKDKEIVDEIKDLRIKRAKKFKNEYLNKLAGMYGADPNYRDQNRNYNQEQRELPPNTFKNTNRQMVYNYIVKKRNDKILEKIKVLEEKNQQNQLTENQQNNNNQPKLFQYIQEQNQQNPNQNIVNQAPENKNTPILLKPIENEGGEVAENVAPKENSLLDKFIKTPQNLLNDANKILQFDNQQENIENKNSNMNIPPVYVKQQNGENDFKNADVVNNVNNIETIPQFVN
jgi:hypothetical protein